MSLIHLEYKILNCEQLHNSYLPFIKNSAIIIESDTKLELGQAVSVSLTLMNQPEPLKFTGTVVWIKPPTYITNDKHKVGVQLEAEQSESLSRQFERCLLSFPSREATANTQTLVPSLSNS